METEVRQKEEIEEFSFEDPDLDEFETNKEKEDQIQNPKEHLITQEEHELDDEGNIIYNNNEQDNSDDESDDVISLLLKSKGIDPKAIKIENENGEIEEVDFNSLSAEEQLSILEPDEELNDDYGLDNEEIDFINQLREANLSPSQYIEMIKQQAVKSASQEESGSILDSMSDDELFLEDLRNRIPEITEDEAAEALALEKTNADFYKKKMDALRNEYKNYEARQNEYNEAQRKEELQKQYAEYENTIKNAITELSEGIDLGEQVLAWTTDDKNDVASFILDEDKNGIRYIAKALSDPKTLVEMSWFALKGKEAISQISDYYKAKITEVGKTNYNKGYEDGKNGNRKNEVKAVVHKTVKQNTNRELSIDDLDY